MIPEPPTITQVAEWMRDRTWLDMRCPDGKADRVRVIGLQITFTADTLVVNQAWIGDDERVHNRAFMYDLEECWDCRPSTVELLDVRPIKGHAVADAPTIPAPHQLPDEVQDVIDVILDEMCAQFNYLTRPLLLGREEYTGHQYITHHRHQTILIVYEMTDLPPKVICTKVFNYASVQPWVTACCKAKPKPEPCAQTDGMRRTIMSVGCGADRFFTEKRRRTKPFPADYSPVLAT